MARQEKLPRQQKLQMDAHQRQVRRSQVIMAIFSILLIVSMLIGLLVNI